MGTRRKTLINQTTLSTFLRKFGVATDSVVTLDSLPSAFRDDIIQYWNWFLLEKRNPVLIANNSKQTLLNFLVCFCLYMNKLGYRVFSRSQSFNVLDTPMAMLNDIASKQASMLNNLLIRSLLPRKLQFVKHRITNIDVGSIDTELNAASYFRVTGTIAYKARKTSILYQILAALRGGLYGNSPPKLLLFPPKPVSADRLVGNHNSCSALWLSLFDWSGISLDAAKSVDNTIVFRYNVAMECALFSANTSKLYITQKVKKVWLSHFYPQ